jgi:hypothetical protein
VDYIYSVSFGISTDQRGELEIGAPLEEALSYLRSLLPGEPGFVSARAMYALKMEKAGQIGVVFQSVWDTWENAASHQESALAEDKVLRVFQPRVELQGLRVQVYEEVP